jgi:hypothetical protein
MRKNIAKFILLLTTVLMAPGAFAENYATMERPDSETRVLVDDEFNPRGIEQSEIDALIEAERANVPTQVLTLTGSPFEEPPVGYDQLPSTKPAAQPTAEETAAKVAALKNKSRVLIIRRIIGVGGLTSLTMAMGYINSHASPATIATAAAIGAIVGGTYSGLLQKFNVPIQGFIKKGPFVGQVVKQMLVPIGLALSVHTAKMIADAITGTKMGDVFHDPAQVKGIAQMVASSSYFQLGWQMLNADTTKQQKAAVAGDAVKTQEAVYRNDKRVFALALALSVANASQLAGMGSVSTTAAMVIGTAGLTAYTFREKLFGLKAPARQVASIETPKPAHGARPSVFAPVKNVIGAIGALCNWAALSARRATEVPTEPPQVALSGN